MKKTTTTIIAGIFSFGNAMATVTLPHHMTDNMVVQQNSVYSIKGKAAANSDIFINAGWNNTAITAHSDDCGNFTAKLATPPAGGPFSIVFTDKDGSTVLENVLSGEVWLCSGQSNMEFPVQGWTTVMDYDRIVATAHHPDIRLLQVKKTTAFTPQEDVEVNAGGWQICSSASIADFSAIAYFFAQELSEKLKVPVGVIDTTWGGTPAEAWTSAEALESVPGFEAELSDLKTYGGNITALHQSYQERSTKWKEMANAPKESVDTDWKKITMPGYWENSVLPEFDGIVWLQKNIDIPADAAGKDLTLSFAAIDDEDETYFNDILVGKGAGYNTPRSYTVDGSLVRSGSNVIKIKISDFGGEGGIAPGTSEAVIGNLSIPIDGDWQYKIQCDFSQLPSPPVAPNSSSYPSVLYNAMLSPLAQMPIKGVLWYQGCANVGRDRQYEPLFKALINNWRSLWGKNLPFYFVQLAGYLKPAAIQPDSKWAALRNAQAKALELDNTAMAVAIDLGNPADIHPKNKQDVAHRLALIALNRDYGYDCIYEAPRCISIERTGKNLKLKFDSQLFPTSSSITGFIISGKDGKYTTATPVMTDKHTILLGSPTIEEPAYVKYNWADYPIGNLYGPTGLPVAPFSNDK